ncbi:MAG: hypothetical protein IKZ92_05485 [Muribaculaceae bacterium]|nr:hypothetical protein [Muribaculaceae bacterium]
MNKSLLIIATLGLLILFTSAYYSSPADSRIGYKAPALILGNDDNGLSPLQQHRGEMVLLTFWSSVDAESRISNIHYDRLSRHQKAYTHVSVNLDRSMSVYNNIVVIDDLNRSAQFCSSPDVQNAIIRSWRLDEGYHSFLIDAQGVIIAVDPDEKILASLH